MSLTWTLPSHPAPWMVVYVAAEVSAGGLVEVLVVMLTAAASMVAVLAGQSVKLLALGVEQHLVGGHGMGVVDAFGQ